MLIIAYKIIKLLIFVSIVLRFNYNNQLALLYKILCYVNKNFKLLSKTKINVKLKRRMFGSKILKTIKLFLLILCSILIYHLSIIIIYNY
jgi:hypothetical protein